MTPGRTLSTRSRRALLALAVALAAACLAVGTAAQEDVRCLSCHGKPGFKKTLASGKVLELFVDPTSLRLSVHKDKHCVDCHADVSEVPHPNVPQKVNCRRCHYSGNTAGAPQIEKYVEFEQSVHGKALAEGNTKAPACQDCHGDHFILPGSDPRSEVSHKNLPQVCGRCHLEIFGQYEASVHGKALAKGIMDAPVCTNCHGEHTIRKAADASSSVNAGHVANTCAKCHAKVVIMEKYGVKAEQVATYNESFHGIANEFGVLTAANCASCHTAHDILPENDPRSSVNAANIPKTCGKCHAGANANFANGRIHINAKDKSAGIVYWIALGFKILTLSTLAGLFVHIGLDLYRKFRNRKAHHGEAKP
jgi:hypothetical protein